MAPENPSHLSVICPSAFEMAWGLYLMLMGPHANPKKFRDSNAPPFNNFQAMMLHERTCEAFCPPTLSLAHPPRALQAIKSRLSLIV